MKPRKVLYVAKTAKGGSALSLYHLAKELDKNRYQPIVLFYTKDCTHIVDKLAEAGITIISLGKQTQKELPPAVTLEPVKRRDISHWLETHWGKLAGQTYTFFKACYQFVRWEIVKIGPILQVIKENQIDLVHANNGLYHGKPEVIAARFANVPCVCHVRMFNKLNLFDKIFVRWIDYFIYISQAIAEDYLSQGIPTAKGRVVHNGVDLDEFSLTFDTASVRSEFGWTPVERVVGVVGRLDWWKGHEYFLEAMAEVSKDIPNVRGLIIGQPGNTKRNQAYFQQLQSLRKRLGLEEKIIFTGFRGDVPRLMAALDVVVLSSSTPEPFGRVVIEGMAAGKPVIATGAGGVLDIIEDKVNGLLVPCQDSQAMAQAIRWLLSNREQADKIGLTARQCVAERFTVQPHAAAVQSVYDATLGLTQSLLIM